MTDASPKLLRAHDGHRDDEPLVRRRALAVAKHLARARRPCSERSAQVVLTLGSVLGTTMLQQSVSIGPASPDHRGTRPSSGGSITNPARRAWQDYALCCSDCVELPLSWWWPSLSSRATGPPS